MDIENVYSIIYNFLITNPLIAIAILAVLALFLWKKPNEFFKFVLMVVVAIVLFYILSLMTKPMSTGVDKKHEITTEREEKLSKETE